MSVTPENTFDHVELVRHLLAAASHANNDVSYIAVEHIAEALCVLAESDKLNPMGLSTLDFALAQGVVDISTKGTLARSLDRIANE